MGRLAMLFGTWALLVSSPFAMAFDVVPDPSRRLSFGHLLVASLSLQQQQRDQSAVTAATASYEQTLAQGFPHAMTYSTLVQRVSRILSAKSNDPNNSPIRLATSFCCDEVNRGLEFEFEACYGNHFDLGGLGGFPFSGVTGFKAMKSHIPDNGSALIVYGPHVGIDADGVLGKIGRRGQHDETSCCGSATAAMNYSRQQAWVPTSVPSFAALSTVPLVPLDWEQSLVNALVLSQKDRLLRAQNPMLELPYALFDMQDLMFQQIILEAAPKCPLALLGGVQINTPDGKNDYFCPLRFDMTNIARPIRYRNLLNDLLY